MAAEWRARRLLFGEVAELYDRHRPGYPTAVFDRIFEYGPLRPGDAALEVGAGTGRATGPLLDRGLLVTALEPSAEMAAVLRRNLAGSPGLTVEPLRFESYRPRRGAYRLVASAQAWHWVSPAIRLRKAARALAEGGCLALFWNRPGPTGTALEEELAAVYRRVAPWLLPGLPGEVEGDRRSEIAAARLFSGPVREEFPWTISYSTADYLGLTSTQSQHRLLEPELLSRLLRELGEVLDRNGGQLIQSYSTLLYLARRVGPGAGDRP